MGSGNSLCRLRAPALGGALWKRAQADEALKAQLYQQIGPLKGALAWLKKKLDLTVAAKRRLIEPTPTQLSMARQCALLGVPRSWVYARVGGRAPGAPSVEARAG